MKADKNFTSGDRLVGKSLGIIDQSVCMHAELLSHVLFFVTLWTIECPASLFMRFSRQEYWSRLPFSPPGNLPYPGVEPVSPALAGGYFYHCVIRAS